MKGLFVFLICLLVLKVDAQNLIGNPTFEESGMPYCMGWINSCQKEISCDSLADCQTQPFHDAPKDLEEDQWSLLIYGNSFPFEAYADYYITGITGTFVYQFGLWMNTEHMTGYGRLGYMKQGVFSASKEIEDLLNPWKFYLMLDTLTTVASDTIAVRLAAGIGDFCICDVYFDQVELSIVDSLQTGTDPVSNLNSISVSPNPSDDQIKLTVPGYVEYIVTIVNYNGQRIIEKVLEGEENIIDMSSQHEGIYFYIVTDPKDKRQLATGRFVKIGY